MKTLFSIGLILLIAHPSFAQEDYSDDLGSEEINLDDILNDTEDLEETGELDLGASPSAQEIPDEEAIDAEMDALPGAEPPPQTLEPESVAEEPPPPQIMDEPTDDSMEDLLRESENEDSIVEEESGPPREPPFVDEEDENYLSTAIQDAEDVGNNPVLFGKLPGEETDEEKRAKYKSDDYYQDLTRVNIKGEHLYDVEASPLTSSIGFRFGSMAAPTLTRGNFDFVDVYEESQVSTLMIDYEWILMKSIGRLGLRVSGGFFTANGKGRFEDGTEAREKYTLYAFPLELTFAYRFEYFHNQLLVPYAAGGVNYFGMVEIRDDNSEPGVGGAPALNFAGGLAILLDYLDLRSIRNIDRKYGVNHIWLFAEFRQFVGLNSEIDFTSSYINAGVTFDY